MFKKFTAISSKITWKIWLLFLLLSQAIYFIMQFFTIPRITKAAGGLGIFDMKPLGYTYDYAYRFLSQLSEEGCRIYKHIQLPLDIFFPLLNFLAGIFALILLIRVYRRVNNKPEPEDCSLFLKVILALPLIAMVFDYLENIMIALMLNYKAEAPRALVSTANIFTRVKSTSTLTYYIVCIIILIAIGLTWLRRTKINGRLRLKREKESTAENSNIAGNDKTAANQGD